jgi:hypothetical protein
MIYTDTLKVSYGETKVVLSIKDGDYSVVSISYSLEDWDGMMNIHRDAPADAISIKVELSETVDKFFRISSRDFRTLIANYDLRKSEGV